MAGAPQQEASVVAAEPALALTEVLVLSGDVPLGATVDGQIRWQPWPTDAVGENFI